MKGERPASSYPTNAFSLAFLLLDFGEGPGHAVSVVTRAARWEAATEEVLQ